MRVTLPVNIALQGWSNVQDTINVFLIRRFVMEKVTVLMERMKLRWKHQRISPCCVIPQAAHVTSLSTDVILDPTLPMESDVEMGNVSRDSLGVMEFVIVATVMMKKLVTSGSVRLHLSLNVKFLEDVWIQAWCVMDMLIVEKMTGTFVISLRLLVLLGTFVDILSQLHLLLYPYPIIK